MKITPFVPDLPALPASPQNDVGDFSRAVNAAGEALGRADNAESAFALGTGGLQDAILERAKADVVLSVAAAAVQRTAQAISTIISMQI